MIEHLRGLALRAFYLTSCWLCPRRQLTVAIVGGKSGLEWEAGQAEGPGFRAGRFHWPLLRCGTRSLGHSAPLSFSAPAVLGAKGASLALRTGGGQRVLTFPSSA